MQKMDVAACVAVRLEEDERNAVADIVAALRTPRCPHVSVSDAMRAAVRELHGAVVRERGL